MRATVSQRFLNAAARFVVVANLCYGQSLVARPIGQAPDRVLLKFEPQVLEDEAQNLIVSLGAAETQIIPHIGVRVLKVAPSRLAQVLEALSHNPKVESAEPDVILEPDFTPDDHYFSSQ
jgi:hypothetical protein